MQCKFLILFAMVAILFAIGAPDQAVAQTDYAVPVTLAVTSTGINRYIASQWGSMTKNWSGYYLGLNYSFSLDRPTIVLSPNTIRISLKLNISSYVYSGSVILTPTLIVPSTTINASNIIAQYSDLHQQIIHAAQLGDSRLQYVVEQALAPISWIMYQGQALSVSTVRWSSSSDIAWKGLPTLTASVANNEVDFTVTPTVTATPPQYSFEWSRTSNQQFGFRISSNNMFSVNGVTFVIGSQRIPLTAESYNPVDATFDPSIQKYVAAVYMTTNRPVVNVGTFYANFKFNRGSAEPIWVLTFQWIGQNYPQTWTSNSELSSNPWGE